MAKPGSAGPSSAMTWIWMVAALVVVTMFLVWLGVTSEPSAVAAPQVDTMQAAGPPSGEPIEAADLESDAQALVGRQVQVSLSVQGKLGSQLVWMNLPNDQRYLVKTDEATAAGLQSGMPVIVVGTVRMVSDSLLSAWRSGGVITSDGDAAQAETSATYLDAAEIRSAG